MLGEKFFTYGWEVVRFNQWAWPLEYDLMKRLFPRMAKCEFYQYDGPTGTVEHFDKNMCLLAVNILSESLHHTMVLV